MNFEWGLTLLRLQRLIGCDRHVMLLIRHFGGFPLPPPPRPKPVPCPALPVQVRWRDGVLISSLGNPTPYCTYCYRYLLESEDGVCSDIGVFGCVWQWKRSVLA